MFKFFNHLGNGKFAQAWGLDALIATGIFISGIVVLFVYTINYESSTQNTVGDFYFEGYGVSELILDNYGFGILSDDVVNQTRLEAFYNLNYETQKNKLGIVHNFYFTLDNLEINGLPVSYVGKINNTPINNLVVVKRLIVYKNSPLQIKFYIWN